MIELIFFTVAMAATIFLLFYLIFMNSLISTLYDFGLQFNYEWAGRYYLMLRLGFILLSVIVVTSLSMVILHRRVLKEKMPSLKGERYPQNLMERIRQLRLELWKYKRKPTGVAGSILLFLGATALASSIIYTSSILALIGLGLTFWGILFTFIRPVRYVKSSLLESTSISALTNVARVISSLNYKGKGIYLPPRYLEGLKEGTVFIPSNNNSVIPTAEEISKQNIFLKNPEGICITPSGLGLVNLYEKELGIDFAKVDLKYLQDNLPQLFVEGLEIAEDFEMRMQGSMVHVKMTETIYKDICSEIRKMSNNCSYLECPLCSSIACALARSSGEPVVIEKIEPSNEGKIIEASYRVMGKIPSLDFLPEKQIAVSFEKPSPEEVTPLLKAAAAEATLKSVKPNGRTLSYLLGLVLVAIGLYTLAWIGWLIFYDVIIWGKSIILILFGSRTGEAIGLGIGVKVIHYILTGIFLLLTGVYGILQKRGE